MKSNRSNIPGTIQSLASYMSVNPALLTVKNKTLLEQVKLIQELEPDEKSTIFKMVDAFLTKKKFKDFFQKNISTL